MTGPTSSPPSATTSTRWQQIRHWLEVFLHRFFQTSQFKRSALPNAPKVGSGGLAVAALGLARAVRQPGHGVAPGAARPGPGALKLR